jgi:hypothetical protein
VQSYAFIPSYRQPTAVHMRSLRLVRRPDVMTHDRGGFRTSARRNGRQPVGRVPLSAGNTLVSALSFDPRKEFCSAHRRELPPTRWQQRRYQRAVEGACMQPTYEDTCGLSRMQSTVGAFGAALTSAAAAAQPCYRSLHATCPTCSSCPQELARDFTTHLPSAAAGSKYSCPRIYGEHTSRSV